MLTETTHIINECLRMEMMPDSWKVGTVTPLPKGKITMDPGDFRPVSVLPMPSKILERVVYNQLVYYFEDNGYLYDFQHGFRKGFSTSLAIFDYVQYLYDSYDTMQCSSSIFVDYRKAFGSWNFM